MLFSRISYSFDSNFLFQLVERNVKVTRRSFPNGIHHALLMYITHKLFVRIPLNRIESTLSKMSLTSLKICFVSNYRAVRVTKVGNICYFQSYAKV